MEYNLQDVIEGNMFGDMSIRDNQFDILRTFHTDLMPEEKQRLLVVMHGDRRL